KLWADALEHLFMAPDRIENLGVVGRARVSGTFTLEREVDDYISLYRRMLESSPISQAPLAVGV
uniref:glycosyltransferase n=1 Tax=Sneathiella sp. TaxID=1964365 RepID=UPI003568B55C